MVHDHVLTKKGKDALCSRTAMYGSDYCHGRVTHVPMAVAAPSVEPRKFN